MWEIEIALTWRATVSDLDCGKTSARLTYQIARSHFLTIAFEGCPYEGAGSAQHMKGQKFAFVDTAYMSESEIEKRLLNNRQLCTPI